MMDGRTKIALRSIARRASAPVWQRLRPRIETIVTERTRQLTTPVQDGLADLRSELGALREEVADLRRRLDWTEGEVKRIGPYVTTMDERLGTVERKPVVVVDDPAEAAEVSRLVDEVRTEHARIRARATAIARYEERIARLENSLSNQPDPDLPDTL